MMALQQHSQEPEVSALQTCLCSACACATSRGSFTSRCGSSAGLRPIAEAGRPVRSGQHSKPGAATPRRVAVSLTSSMCHMSSHEWLSKHRRMCVCGGGT